MSSTLNEMGKIKILAIAEAAMPSTEICLSIPLNYLKSMEYADFKMVYENNLEHCHDLKSQDLVIALRSVRNSSIRFLKKCLNQGIPIISMFDDDFEAIPPSHWLFRHYSNIGAKSNTKILLGMSNKCAVFSNELRLRYSHYVDDIEVLPVTDSTSDEVGLSDIFENTDNRMNEFRIGYAASSTHKENIEIISNSLLQCLGILGDDYYVESIGQKIVGLEGHPRYRHFEFIDGLDKFFDFMRTRQWQIGLAPLSCSPQNSIKTENKFRTYALACVPGIYSNVKPFNESITNDKTGVLVDNNEYSWKNAIIELAHNKAKRAEISSLALARYREQYHVSRVADRYKELIESVMALPKILIAVEPVDRHAPRMFRLLDMFENAKSLLCRFRSQTDCLEDDIKWCDVAVFVTYKPENAGLDIYVKRLWDHPVLMMLIKPRSVSYNYNVVSMDVVCKLLYDKERRQAMQNPDRVDLAFESLIRLINNYGIDVDDA